jgi:dephospho-CoA kinase
MSEQKPVSLLQKAPLPLRSLPTYRWIALTGGIATGKSTAAEFLRKSAVAVIDADQLARQALAPESPLVAQVIQHFGPEVIESSPNVIDRKALGIVVFNDAKARLWLEDLIHPWVQTQVQIQKSNFARAGHKLIVYDIPLVFEKNLVDKFDGVLSVLCSPQLQIERLRTRSHLSDAEIQSRIQAQVDQQVKREKSNWVIENDGSKADLEIEVRNWLARI